MQAMAFFTPKNSLFLAMIFVCVAQVAPLVPIYRKMGHMPFYVGHMGLTYMFLHVFCVGPKFCVSIWYIIVGFSFFFLS